MKNKDKRKRKWIILIVIIIAICLFLSIYLFKPWIPTKYSDPSYCDENVGCGAWGAEQKCINEYHKLGDAWLVLGVYCSCDEIQHKCIRLSEPPPLVKTP